MSRQPAPPTPLAKPPPTGTAGVLTHALGARKPRYPSQRILSVAYPDEMFTEVRRLAQRSGVSVSEQMRTLVQWGLDSMEDADGGI